MEPITFVIVIVSLLMIGLLADYAQGRYRIKHNLIFCSNCEHNGRGDFCYAHGTLTRTNKNYMGIAKEYSYPNSEKHLNNKNNDCGSWKKEWFYDSSGLCG